MASDQVAHPTFVLCLAIVLSASIHAQNEKTPRDWQPYLDKEDRVSVRVPPGWKRPTDKYLDRTYFEGADGFFQLSEAKGESPEQLCRGAAMHVLQPFGKNPKVSPVRIWGRDGCIVWPSEDQGAPWDAEVVLPYPRPVVIDGNAYNQLIVDGDKSHVLAIAKTIEFQP
jgi:TolB protein